MPPDAWADVFAELVISKRRLQEGLSVRQLLYRLLEDMPRWRDLSKAKAVNYA